MQGRRLRTHGLQQRPRRQAKQPVSVSRQGSMAVGREESAAKATAKVAWVRPGRREDAEALHRIIQQAYRTELSWTTEVNLVKGERISLPQLQAQLAAQKDPIFVAETRLESGDAAIAGCICAEWAKLHPDVGLSEECTMFGLFAVDPAHQSVGIGTRLLQHAVTFAKEEWGCERAVLWVIKQRTEILAWYERLGFEWHGETRDFVFPELALHDEVEFRVLSKRL